MLCIVVLYYIVFTGTVYIEMFTYVYYMFYYIEFYVQVLCIVILYYIYYIEL